MKYLFTQEQIQTILDYLVKQPYQDVFQLILVISQAEKVKNEEKKDK